MLLRLALLGNLAVHVAAAASLSHPPAGTQANHSYPRLGNCW